QAGGGIAGTSNVTLAGSSASLVLSNVNDTVASLTFTGGSVSTGSGTLTEGGTVTTNASSSTATISGNLALGNNTVFTIASGTVQSGPDLDISAGISGNYSITKAGPGTMQLDGANSYGGNTNINQGILNITSQLALAGSPTVTVQSGAELEM